MKNILSYLSARASEPSTMAGLTLVAGGVYQALQAGGSKAAFLSAGVSVLGGLVASVVPEAAIKTPSTVSVSAQVASMASELAAVSKAVSTVSTVAAVAAPVANAAVGAVKTMTGAAPVLETAVKAL